MFGYCDRLIINLISMKQNISTFFLFVVLFFVSTGTSIAATLVLETGSFQKDDDLKLILVYHPHYDFKKETYTSIDLGGKEFVLEKAVNKFDTKTRYLCSSEGKIYSLYFTSYPVVSVEIDAEINDEEKQLATFSYCDKQQLISSKIGIKHRGMTSLLFPKKSFTVEFWEDDLGEISKDMKFGKLRKDDDWVLDGVYNEFLRMRAYLCHKLWLDMHEDKKSKPGADVMFVELFLNNQYRGIYLLSEKIDRKLLDLKKSDEEMRGELYKARGYSPECLFKDARPFEQYKSYWKGWECQYPKDDKLIEWDNFHDYVHFVAYSSQEEFNEQIWKQTDKENFINYYLFVNLIMGVDNYGKNLIVARKDRDKPYYIVPWDLDCTFDISPHWGYLYKYDSLIANNFMEKALNDTNYWNEVKAKWAHYRADLYSFQRLTRNVDDIYDDFNDNLVYKREHIVYPTLYFDANHLNHFKTWIANRLLFLDDYFGYDIGIGENDQRKILVYPNPVYSTCRIKDDKARNTTYFIYNTFGEMVASGPFDGELRLDFSKHSPGVYIIRIDNNIAKLVVNR